MYKNDENQLTRKHKTIHKSERKKVGFTKDTAHNNFKYFLTDFYGDTNQYRALTSHSTVSQGRSC